MSRPPKTRKPEFPDPDVHATKKDLYKEIRETVINLRGFTPKGGDRNTMISYANVIQPGSFIDEGRLPYIGRNDKAKSKRKIECVFALLNNLIAAYWQFKLSGSGESKVRELLDEARAILKNGLKKYKVAGDEANGYTLSC